MRPLLPETQRTALDQHAAQLYTMQAQRVRGREDVQWADQGHSALSEQGPSYTRSELEVSVGRAPNI